MIALANLTKMCYTCDRRLHLQYNMEVLMNRKITLFFRALAYIEEYLNTSSEIIPKFFYDDLSAIAK